MDVFLIAFNVLYQYPKFSQPREQNCCFQNIIDAVSKDGNWMSTLSTARTKKNCFVSYRSTDPPFFCKELIETGGHRPVQGKI